MQTLLTALIVTGCTAQAAWLLMPSAWRRALVQRLPGAAARATAQAQGAASACGGCTGCSGPARSAAPGPTTGLAAARAVPIVLHRRRPGA